MYYVQRVTADSIAVSGTGSTATTTITVPASFTPVAGGIYDILLTAQVPAGTDRTIVNITNGTVEGAVFKRFIGDYARARCLGCRQVIRVQFFDDPEHYNLLGVRS